MSGISIQNVSKDFFSLRGRINALDKISLEINSGEFFVLLGPSGCGKSTLLNIIAGIEKPTTGEITINDTIAVSTNQRTSLSPQSSRPIRCCPVKCPGGARGRRAADEFRSGGQGR